eukprot:Gb_26080 [translate_table: standard]
MAVEQGIWNVHIDNSLLKHTETTLYHGLLLEVLQKVNLETHSLEASAGSIVSSFNIFKIMRNKTNVKSSMFTLLRTLEQTIMLSHSAIALWLLERASKGGAWMVIFYHNCIQLWSFYQGRQWLNHDEVWRYMKGRQETFVQHYKAYSHLRSKNWVVRSGLQYGADFVVYRHHPALVHSEFQRGASFCLQSQQVHQVDIKHQQRYLCSCCDYCLCLSAMFNSIEILYRFVVLSPFHICYPVQQEEEATTRPISVFTRPK